MDKLQHRKAARIVTLKDAQGRPMAGRNVRAQLRNHAFLFGCGAFDLLPLLDPATPSAQRERLTVLWEAWQEVFNYGTLPFYQGRYEPIEGQPDDVRMHRAADLLAKKGFQAKGHPLCWHTASAKWLLQKDAQAVLQNQLGRIRREIGAFKGQIRLWDVINEVVIMPDFDKEDNAITRLCQRMGRVPLVKALFDEAKRMDPDATLLINDFNLSDKYRQLIEQLLAAGVGIDAIGLQTHQHQGAMGLEKLQQVVERFEGFGLPLHFTENTFISGELMPPEIVDLNDFKVDTWPSTPKGEDRQARDLLEMLDFLFERPSVEAMTTWCIVDGQWLKAPAGLLRLDGSRKPAFDALRQRVRKDWTTDAALTANERGEITLEGFRGEYALTADGLTGSVSLDKSGTPCVATLQ